MLYSRCMQHAAATLHYTSCQKNSEVESNLVELCLGTGTRPARNSMLSIVISITGPSARGSCSFSPNSLISVAARLQTDVRQLFINGYPVVIEAGRLQDDAGRAHEDGQREYPEEEAVQHHRHVLPVLLHLKEGR